MKDFWEILNKAFQTLLDPESRNLFDWDVLLTNVLQCVELLVADERTNSVPSMNHNFELLRSCETVLRSPRCPEEARQLGRKLRIDVIKFWAQVYGAQRYEPGCVVLRQVFMTAFIRVARLSGSNWALLMLYSSIYPISEIWIEPRLHFLMISRYYGLFALCSWKPGVGPL